MYSGRELREVFHFCFLERLLKAADPALFVRKGGANLRFFFKSPRYSEDMDLDVLAGSVPTLKKSGYKVLEDAALGRTLRTYGIVDLEINADVTQRFRVRLVTTSGERLPSKIEFSRRAGRSRPMGHETAPIDHELARRYRRLTFRCQHYDGPAAVVQKVLALAGRPTTQARDVFDLDVLARGGQTVGLDVRALSGTAECEAALANLDSLRFEDFSGQVLEFLDDEQRREIGTPAAWQAMVDQARQLLGAP